jgi:hypothetical protein
LIGYKFSTAINLTAEKGGRERLEFEGIGEKWRGNKKPAVQVMC